LFIHSLGHFTQVARIAVLADTCTVLGHADTVTAAGRICALHNTLLCDCGCGVRFVARTITALSTGARSSGSVSRC
jgi:hypothetical protein